VAAALQARDVDFLRRTLAGDPAAATRRRHPGGDQGPKYGSERAVSVPDELSMVLARHVEIYTNGTSAKRWVFAGEPGGCMACAIATRPA